MATLGIWLPIEVIRDKSLTMQEKLILMEISQLVKLDSNSCFASNEHFAELLNTSVKSVSNTISSLVKKEKIEVKLSDRNHKRLLSIISGLLSTKSGGLSIKSGESKDNKTINITINTYEGFLSLLKDASKYKTKVTINKKHGKKIFDTIEDKEKLFNDYLAHQEEKKEYAVRITAYMEDYKTVYLQDTPTAKENLGGWN